MTKQEALEKFKTVKWKPALHGITSEVPIYYKSECYAGKGREPIFRDAMLIIKVPKEIRETLIQNHNKAWE